MPSVRDLFVIESPQPMAVGESKAFVVDFADKGTPTAINSVIAYDAAGTNVSVATLTGSGSISGDTVILPQFAPASAQKYRLVANVTISGNVVIGAVDVLAISIIPSATVTNGYATLPEFISYARVETTDPADDAVIIQLIETASRYIDNETKRTFYARTTETRYFDVPDDFGRCLMFDDDLLSITTFTNGDGSAIASTNYVLLPYNDTPKYALEMLPSSTVMWLPTTLGNYERALSITGSWGYAATAPADIKLTCMAIAESLYKRRFGENLLTSSFATAAGVVITPMDVPDWARLTLHNYRRLVY
jgi:hypothetical protein